MGVAGVTRKYEFTGETLGNLKRIRRLSDGVLGGYIEHEWNLSHEGDAWVGDDAHAYEHAQVTGNAQVYGNARLFGFCRVSDDAQVFDFAWVFGYARLFGNAVVYGKAAVYAHTRLYGDVRISAGVICGNADLNQTPMAITRSDHYTFTLFPCADGVWRMSAGCRYFTMEKAWDHWRKTRADTDLGRETFKILMMFEDHIEKAGKAWTAANHTAIEKEGE